MRPAGGGGRSFHLPSEDALEAHQQTAGLRPLVRGLFGRQQRLGRGPGSLGAWLSGQRVPAGHELGHEQHRGKVPGGCTATVVTSFLQCPTCRLRRQAGSRSRAERRREASSQLTQLLLSGLLAHDDVGPAEQLLDRTRAMPWRRARSPGPARGPMAPAGAWAARRKASERSPGQPGLRFGRSVSARSGGRRRGLGARSVHAPRLTCDPSPARAAVRDRVHRVAGRDPWTGGVSR